MNSRPSPPAPKKRRTIKDLGFIEVEYDSGDVKKPNKKKVARGDEDDDDEDYVDSNEGSTVEMVSVSPPAYVSAYLYMQPIDVDKPKSSKLPREVTEGHRWQTILIPTLLKYLGTRANPWEALPLSVVQRVWNRVYDTDEFGPKFSHAFVFNDSIHTKVFLPSLFSFLFEANNSYTDSSQGVLVAEPYQQRGGGCVWQLLLQ